MSTTIVAVLVQLLALGLPQIGVTVGTDSLTNALTTLLVVVSGVWIWIERVRRGDVSALGRRHK
jgi:drug/metabolite transporter (DMT)-like permease